MTGISPDERDDRIPTNELIAYMRGVKLLSTLSQDSNTQDLNLPSASS